MSTFTGRGSDDEAVRGQSVWPTTAALSGLYGRTWDVRYTSSSGREGDALSQHVNLVPGGGAR
jgi:hypothetical protein